jgi:peptidoglycan hydrolase CwlO-like protein
MITLEQIRLLESKIARAIELIRVLKEENSTLHKGLESAQKRMKELETLVDGFKTDQKEIESVIVRTLHTLDEVEENVSAKHQDRSAAAGGISPAAHSGSTPAAAGGISPAAKAAAVDPPSPAEPVPVEAGRAAKEELDIF